jgi:hypothetical protein
MRELREPTMTRITPGRRLKRETDSRDRTRSIIVTLESRALTVGLKGTRERYLLDYETVLALGRKLDAREKLRAKGKRV